MTKKQLTRDQFVQILIRHERGESVSALAVEFNVHRTTLNRRISAYHDTGKLDRAKNRRPMKLSRQVRERIRKYVTDNPFDTLKNVKVALNLEVSTNTISKICRRFGIKKLICPKKFYISPIQCESRLETAIMRSFWLVERWKNVAFSDESGIDNSGYYRRFVFRPAKSRNLPKFTYHPPNSSMRRLNFFSYFSKHGTGKLVFYDSMNSQTYCDCLKIMIEDLTQKFEHENFLVVHDNAAWANSDYTRNFIEQNNYRRFLLAIPPYSPDMNPIENLWAILKQKVREHCFLHGQTARPEFANLVESQWAQISQSIVDKIYLGLPNRMKAIVESRGELTRY